MRHILVLFTIVLLTACTERQVFQVQWLDDRRAFSIEMTTQPQEPETIAVEALENEAKKICDQFGLPAVIYAIAQEKRRTNIFDTTVSGGKIRGTFRCQKNGNQPFKEHLLKKMHSVGIEDFRGSFK